MCGGSSTAPLPPGAGTGLSPRVRGKHGPMYLSTTPIRSIPACAGEARVRLGQECGNRVYPRVCGGSRAAPLPAEQYGGLSPRVRGKPAGAFSIPARMRSIPACAGEASGRRPLGREGGVYPRVCGGSGYSNGGSFTSRGLSPRVRGKRVRAARSAPIPRSIPACAGEAVLDAVIRLVSTVYPRVCGGSVLRPARRSRILGLSPRVRGKHRRVRRG